MTTMICGQCFRNSMREAKDLRGLDGGYIDGWECMVCGSSFAYTKNGIQWSCRNPNKHSDEAARRRRAHYQKRVRDEEMERLRRRFKEAVLATPMPGGVA